MYRLTTTKMSVIVNNLTELIGNTPMLHPKRFLKLAKLEEANLLFKLEYFNPLGSVKDRIAHAMIQDAKEKGVLKENTVIIEPTSGNTGIGLAFVAAAGGYPLVIVMPDSMSVERRSLLKALGAELVLTPGSLGMKGAIRRAEELHIQISNSIILQQFNNEANPKIHRETTGVEIYEATEGKIDILVAGVGTGGTISGVGSYLKEKNPKIELIAVEPYESRVLSGGNPGPHLIQGIGAGFVPKVLNLNIIDEIYTIHNEEALDTARVLAKEEGLLVGISSGAAAYAAVKIGKRPENKEKTIVAILPDTGERYLSTSLFQDIPEEKSKYWY